MAQQPDFSFRNAFYSFLCGSELITFYDKDGHEQFCELPEKTYEYINDLYFNSEYAKQFDGNCAIVDCFWAEEILMPLLEAEANKIATEKTVVNQSAVVAQTANITCHKCGQKLPDDSKFCQYCGTAICEDMPKQGTQEGRISVQVVKPTVAVSSFQAPSMIATTELPQKAGKKAKTKAWMIVLIAIVLISLSFNMVQLSNAKVSADQIKQLSATVSTQKSTISEKNVKIDKLESKIASIEDDAEYFKKIVSAGKKGNTGFANRNFYANTGVVVVNKNSSKKITLGTGINTYYEVDVAYPSIASVSFDEENWWGSTTTLTVRGKKAGVTTATFSNDYDKNTFNVIIIVTG